MNGASPTVRRRKLVFLCVLTVVLVCFTIYISFEIVIRLFHIPDAALIRDIDEQLAWASGTEANFDWEAPIYGWGQDSIIDLSSDISSSMSYTAHTVLFI